MRFIIRKFIEADNMESALKKERRIRPYEIYLDNDVWKERAYSLKDNKQNPIGFNGDKDVKKF